MARTDDYYSTLQIGASATPSEIRRAFRRLVKQHHPDKNPGGETDARERFERIVEAYETLGDETKRRYYDRRVRKQNDAPAPRPTSSDIRVNLAYRVLDLLVAEEQGAALDEFDRLAQAVGGNPRILDFTRFIEYADARDAEFLVAEAFEGARRLDDAWAFYHRCLERESKRPYFRRFTEEIRERVIRIAVERLCDEIAANGLTPSAELSLRHIENLAVNPRARAVALKRLAERVERAGRRDAATALLLRALRTYPKLTGARRLAARLGLSDFVPGDGQGSTEFTSRATPSADAAKPLPDARAT